MESATTFAALTGWPLVAALALAVVAGVLWRDSRQIVLVCIVVWGLLVFWAYSLWRLV
jgi:hypothetical protein